MTMNIENHFLTGEGIEFTASPNHGEKFGSDSLDSIIIHYTAGPSSSSAINTLCDPRVKASAHLVIGRDGSVTQLVPFNEVAWHAGISEFQGRSGFNQYAIGIEIVNAGLLEKTGDGFMAWFGKKYDASEVVEAVHRHHTFPRYWHTFTEEQINIVYEICKKLIETYDLKFILGHEEISPGRKIDPGPAFPLDKLRDRLLHGDRSDNKNDESVPIRKGRVSVGNLNIRSAPALSAAPVASPLLQGTSLTILEQKGDWYKVSTEITGWVYARFVE